MYGVLVRLEIDTARADEAVRMLHEVAIPTIKAAEGFLSGTWMRSLDGARTASVIIFESEEHAVAAAERAAGMPPPGGPASFVSAEVFEVMAQA